MRKTFSITKKLLLFVTILFILAAAHAWFFISSIKGLERHAGIDNILSSIQDNIVAFEYKLDTFIIGSNFKKDYGAEGLNEQFALVDKKFKQLKGLSDAAIFNSDPMMFGDYKVLINDWNFITEEMGGLQNAVSKEEIFLIHNDIDIKVFLIAARLEKLGKFIQDKKEKEISSLTSNVIYSLLFYMVIALIAVYLFYRKIISPLNEFGRTAKKRASGDLAIRFNAASRDEMGVLAGALNSMADAVNEAHVMAEKNVSNRTMELEIRTRELATANKVTGLIGRTLAEGEMAGIVLDELMSATHTDAGWVYLTGGDSEAKLHLNAYRGLSHTFIREAKEVKAEDGGIIGRQIKGKGHIFVNVSEIDNRFRPLLEEIGIKRLCILPIIYADTMIGIINLAGKRSDCFSDKDSNPCIFAESLANEIAVAIDHTRLFQKEFKSKQFMERIIHQSPISIAVFDKNGDCIMLNSAYKKLFGLTRDEQIIGEYNLFKDNELEEKGYAQTIRKIFEGESIDMEIEYDISNVRHIQVKKGARRLKVKMFPIFDNDGSVSNIAAIYEDTVKKPMELR